MMARRMYDDTVTTVDGYWDSNEEIVKQYFTYTHRVSVLRRELRLANRMLQEARIALENNGTIPTTEYLRWSTD